MIHGVTEVKVNPVNCIVPKVRLNVLLMTWITLAIDYIFKRNISLIKIGNSIIMYGRRIAPTLFLDAALHF